MRRRREREKPSEVVDGRTPSQAMRLKSNVDVRIQIDFQLEFSSFKDDGDATLNFYRPIHRHSEVKGHNNVAAPSWQGIHSFFIESRFVVGVGCKMRFPCEKKKSEKQVRESQNAKEKRRRREPKHTTPSEKKGLKSYKGDRRALSIANTRLLRSDLAFFLGTDISSLYCCVVVVVIWRRGKKNKRKRAARKWSASCFTYIPRLIFFACILHCPSEQGWVFLCAYVELIVSHPKKQRSKTIQDSVSRNPINVQGCKNNRNRSLEINSHFCFFGIAHFDHKNEKCECVALLFAVFFPFSLSVPPSGELRTAFHDIVY